MGFEPTVFLSEESTDWPDGCTTLPGPHWLPVNEHGCTFQPEHFLEVALNYIKNPNINSTNLFRADILYDSQSNELTDTGDSGFDPAKSEPWKVDGLSALDGFRTHRCMVRQLIPRNPQLDRPIPQTCLIVERKDDGQVKEMIVILLPHVQQVDDLPFYHPAVRAVAYWYHAPTSDAGSSHDAQEEHTGKVAIHYQLFPGQTLPLDKRLLRTAHHLLHNLHKHGQGRSVGYEKKGQHDQTISQKRVQDRYTELKAKHAKRLCSAWVEQTEPSKHVYEDLGIAAYLIELWRDMYAPPSGSGASTKNGSALPEFPGFVDIGCGNGVLTEVLILSGYRGEGYDARRRKTWAILSPKAQAHLHERLCIPQPLFDLYPVSATATKSKPSSLVARFRSMFNDDTESVSNSALTPPTHPWHNGVPAPGTFIISNHADELTPWTPLLACLSGSPFLAIPCCSHNLSGARFRAPTAFNAYSADEAAPGYFAAQKKPRAKSIPITIPMTSTTEEEGDEGDEGDDHDHEYNNSNEGSSSSTTICTPKAPSSTTKRPETGDLRALAPAQRAKQPSAYASLCEWVAHLGRAAGYVVEREMLRIPSTRNMGLVGRAWAGAAESEEEPVPVAMAMANKSLKDDDDDDHRSPERTVAARKERVQRIVRAEGADGFAWVKRCNEVLAKGGGVVHGRE